MDYQCPERIFFQKFDTAGLEYRNDIFWGIWVIFGEAIKGQIISKGLLVSTNSPKKRTNEFVLLLRRIRSFFFWENLRTSRSPFEIIWPLEDLELKSIFCHQNHPGNSILFTSVKICEDFNFPLRFQNGVMNTTKIFVPILIHLFNLFILFDNQLCHFKIAKRISWVSIILIVLKTIKKFFKITCFL